MRRALTGRRAALRLARRSLTHRWRQLGATVACVAVATAFFAGVVMIIAAAEGAYRGLTTNPSSDLAVVGAADPAKGDDSQQRAGVDAAFVDLVAAVPGVAASAADLAVPVAAISPEGSMLAGTTAAAGVIQLRSWRQDPELNRWAIVDGHAPQGAEVIVDQQLARSTHLAPGDQLRVAGATRTETLTVVGIAHFEPYQDTPARTHGFGSDLFTDLPTAQRLAGRAGEVDRVVVRLIPGADPAIVRAALGDVAGDAAGATVQTGDEVRAADDREATALIGALGALFGTFGAVALFVAVFVIANALSMLVAQRTPELALVRAVGATPRQVRRLVRWEAMGIGLFGSLLGVLGGAAFALAFARLLSTLGLDLEASPVRIVPAVALVPIALGVVTCRLAVWRPARRAGRTAPLELAHSAAVDRSGRSRVRLSLLVLGAAAAVGLTSAGLATQGESGSYLVLAAMGCALAAVAFGGPLVARAVLQLTRPLVDRFGALARLARRTTSRDPRRAGAVASAIMIGVALVAMTVVLAASLQAGLLEGAQQQLVADVVVQPPERFGRGLPADSVATVSAADGVTAAMGVRFSILSLDGDPHVVGVAVDPALTPQLFDLGKVEGRLDALDGDGIAVSRSLAEDRGWSLGDTVPVGFAGGKAILTVGAIFEREPLENQYLVGSRTYGRLDPDSAVDMILASGGPAGSASLQRAVRAEFAADPTVEVLDRQAFAALYSTGQGIGFLYAMLGFVVLVAVMGVATTFTASVTDRTPQLGGLRALGMTRRQLRRLIAIEATLVGGLGCVLGVLIGAGGAALVVIAAHQPDIVQLRLAVPTLVAVTAMGIAASVLAALVPARRAGRIGPLDAMTGR